jgi:hypothetical protein
MLSRIYSPLMTLLQCSRVRRIVRRHKDWHNQEADLKKNLVHLVGCFAPAVTAALYSTLTNQCSDNFPPLFSLMASQALNTLPQSPDEKSNRHHLPDPRCAYWSDGGKLECSIRPTICRTTKSDRNPVSNFRGQKLSIRSSWRHSGNLGDYPVTGRKNVFFEYIRRINI